MCVCVCVCVFGGGRSSKFEIIGHKYVYILNGATYIIYLLKFKTYRPGLRSNNSIMILIDILRNNVISCGN